MIIYISKRKGEWWKVKDYLLDYNEIVLQNQKEETIIIDEKYLERYYFQEIIDEEEWKVIE